MSHVFSGASRSTDSEILDFALTNEFIDVTLDSDFHTILAFSGAHASSVVRVRIEGVEAVRPAILIHSVIGSCSASLKAGAAVTIGASRTSVHRLPISLPHPR